MVGSFVFALTYLLGGVTFLPLCLAVLLAFLYYTSPVVRVPRKTGIPDLAAKSHSTASGEQEDEVEPVNVYRAGWLTVRRTYEPLKVGNDGTYVGMLASGYRSFMDNRSRDPRRSKPKDRFFAVLKQNILFLYEGENQNECWAAIDVSAHDIVIFPEGNIDGELYVKRTAIQLKPRRTEEEGKDATSPTGHAQSEETAYDLETGKPLPWYIFAKVNSDKEDWYHSLQVASRLGNPPATGSIARDRALFDSEDMARLVEAIDAQPDSIPMRWFNALIGRIFLSVYRTSSLENYLTSRIVRKLKRVKLPSMLSEIQVREVNVGASVPLFSKPMLKDLTAEGDASMEVHVAYVGEARVTIETEATVSLGSRFKPYTVRLVLAVVLKELEGTMLVKMKRPPSNRLWFGFTQMPKMVLSVEPVVSARQIKWSMVTGPIESRIRELIMESIVVPHMDDLSFFSTLAEPLFRGGIYGAFLRADKSTASADDLDSSDKKNEVDPSTDGPAEEDLVGEATPSVSKGNEVKEAISSATKEGGAQIRAAAMRRRRSSEGDRPLDLTPMSTSPAATPSANSTRSPPSASSSVTSLAGLSASLASWRENSSSTSMNGSSGASTSRTTTRWFSKSPTPGPSASSASSTPAPSVRTNDSTDLIVSASSATTATGETTSPAQPEVSASQLRDILAKRAEERDREREKEREKAAAVAAAVDRVGLPVVEAEAEEHKEEAEKRKGEERDAANETMPTDQETPLPLNDPSLNSSAPASDSASTPKPPALPNRPSFVKALPTPPPASPAASTTSREASLAAPPPLPRRHSPSASVDSGSNSTTASTASSLLASWRTKVPTSAAERSEALSAAKESMKRWGANWAAKRAQTQQEKEERAKRVEDSDRPVGESPEKERGGAGAGEGNGGGYRDYRKGKSVSSGQGGGGIADYFGTNGSSDSLVAPKTPPRSIPRPSSTTTSTHPAGQLSSSASSTSSGHFAPSSPSASTALSTSSALANSSPSTSPSKPSMLATGPPTMSAGAGYGRRMMTLPGIRDEDKRKKVSQDHLGGGVAAVAASEGEKGKKAEKEGEEVKKEEATSATSTPAPPPVEPSAKSTVADELTAQVGEAETDSAAVASTASTSTEEPQPPVEEPVSSSATVEPPAFPPRDLAPAPSSVEADAPAGPPLPPRKDAGDLLKEVEKAAPTAVEQDSAAQDVPPLPPRDSAHTTASSLAAVDMKDVDEDGADEAGWDLDNEVVVEEGQS